MNNTGNKEVDSCFIEPSSISFGNTDVVFWFLVSIATVAGNGISIWKLLRNKRRWLSQNIFFVSFLSTDFIIGAGLHPLVALATYRGYGSCQSVRATRAFAYFNMSISLWSSLAIAVNRYKALNINKTRAFNRMQSTSPRKNKTPLFVVFSIWSFTTFVSILMISTSISFIRLQLTVPLLLFVVLVLNIIVSFKIRAMYRKINRAILKRSSEYRTHSSSLSLIQLIILNMLMTCLPVIILRSISARVHHVNTLALARANKLYLLSPMLDPLCYILVKRSSI